MKNFEELENFINANSNWQELLKKAPYNLKTVKQFDYNPNWWMLVYNLFESDLDNKIVKECRGTVVEVINGRAKAICAPYTKFFDIQDPHADNINWDSKKLKCEMKVDGQLEKFFKYNGKGYWVTNGGASNDTPLDFSTDFAPDYKHLLFGAVEAKTMNLMKVQYDPFFQISSPDKECWINKVPDGWTLMFELTSPMNKIIVEYNEIKLWFHGARDANGIEHAPEEVAKIFNIPFEIPKRYNLNKKNDILEALSKFNGREQEGFVVVDEENWTRVKMKSPSYLKIKYARDNDTPKGIFNLAMSNEWDDIEDNSIREKVEKQLNEMQALKDYMKKTSIVANDIFKSCKDQKEFAEYVKNHIIAGLKPLFFNFAKKEFENTWENIMKKFITPSGWDYYNELLNIMIQDTLL